MKKSSKENFRFRWVLVNELAIGTAPLTNEHILKLKREGISSILTLCSENEVKLVDKLEEFFNYKRFILPDHKSGRDPTLTELKTSLELLSSLKALGPTFVHCLAAIERSPLICIGWLIKEKNLSAQQALEYMTQINPGTNPLPSQFNVLKSLFVR